MEIKVLPDLIMNGEPGETLMQILVRYGHPVQNICNGRGTCGKCKVRIVAPIPVPTSREEKHLNAKELSDGIRLACQVVPTENMTVEVLMADNKIDRKELGMLGMKKPPLNPGIKSVFLNLPKPSLADERGDWDRIVDELKETAEIKNVNVSLDVVKMGPKIVKEYDYKVTAIIAEDEILGFVGGDEALKLYGAAVDIGTTSVAVALVNLSDGELIKVVSKENEQAAYGADVISRITYARESEENALQLQKAVQKTINDLLREIKEDFNIKPQQIIKMTVVCNTTMHHLFLGLDVSQLAVSPYVSVCNRPLKYPAKELNISINPQAPVYLFPNIGSFVGGDTLGAVLGTKEVLEPGNHLLIDLGTNCELFLKTDKIMLACSTAAGPAFEGAGISNGMRAKKGAIESIKISETGVTYEVIGGQSPLGICGSGLIEGIDEMRKAGVINTQGRIGSPENEERLSMELKSRIRKTERGNEFVLAYNENGRDIVITQKDIASFQYAKGAVCAGIKTLLDMAEITIDDLDSVILSGTFATYLKRENILNIGLVPYILPDKIKIVGNAAHRGAVYALLDSGQLKIGEELYTKIRHVELGGSAAFSDYFMESMYFERQ